MAKRHPTFRILAALAALALVAAGSIAVAQSLPRNETLYIGGHQWGPPTNFNPLSSSPAWPTGGNGQMGINGAGYIFETLFTSNIVDGSYAPALGKDMAWTTPTQLTVHMQPGTMWQDGQPLTSADVKFTFELGKNFSVSTTALWDYLTSIDTPDAQTVVFNLDPARPNPGVVERYVDTVYILPQHIWQAVADQGQSALLQYENFNPVGSGSYTVMSYNAEQIVLQRFDNYWGKGLYGMPTPKYVVHPIFKSNDAGNLALQQGQLDWSQQFVPNVWTMKNVGTWLSSEPYYIPGSIPMMLVNVQRKGLDNVLVRRALAYSINYPLIAQTAMSRYSEPAKSSLIIPSGVESQYFDAQNVDQYGWTYDPAKAKDILENQLHATKGSDGIYVLPDGTKLSFVAQTPYGWTDWMAALQVVSQSAKAVGIDVTTNFPQAPVDINDVQTGNFDLALFYISGVGPDAPWARFRDMMDNRSVPAVGQNAFWDYNRYANPDVPALLDKAGAATTIADKKAAYAELDKIFMRDVPGIPLMYRPLLFYEFNTSVWTNFPTADNPMGTSPQWYIDVLRDVKLK